MEKEIRYTALGAAVQALRDNGLPFKECMRIAKKLGQIRIDREKVDKS